MLPWHAELAGRIEERTLVSAALEDNPLGDPHERPIRIYTPPGYDEDDGRRYPSVYVLQGWAGLLPGWDSRTPFRLPFPEVADSIFAKQEAPPAIIVYVDGWSKYGGSQFVDSPGTGRYHTYLCEDVIAWVDANYRTIPDGAHRGIMGKSSGGYAALITPMLRPDLFSVLASHAGDALFDYSYLPEFGKVVRHLRRYDGDVWRWWEEFTSRVALTFDGDADLAEVLCVAACYSAREDGTVELPFDSRTGVVDPELWQRWLDWDPVRMVPRHAEQMRGMKGIWIDAGVRDQYYLDLGAEAVHEALKAAGVQDDKMAFELFDATHTGIEYRYPLSLAWMCERIAA